MRDTVIRDRPPFGRSSLAGGRRNPFNANAFTATMKLEPDIERPAISGRSVSPRPGSNTPAAIGSAIAL